MEVSETDSREASSSQPEGPDDEASIMRVNSIARLGENLDYKPRDSTPCLMRFSKYLTLDRPQRLYSSKMQTRPSRSATTALPRHHTDSGPRHAPNQEHGY